MSVLKSKQNLSRAEFVNVANEIFTETYQFLSRISARYGRLLAPEICARASDVIDHCEMANKVLPTDKVKAEYRERHLLEALGAVSALDVKMAHLYNIMMKNPQGCFTDTNGKTLEASRATKRLDSMAQSLGEKIDREMNLIKAIATGLVGRRCISVCSAVRSIRTMATISVMSTTTATRTITMPTILMACPSISNFAWVENTVTNV